MRIRRPRMPLALDRATPRPGLPVAGVARRCERGMTLVEVVISMVVLAVAVGGTLGTLSSFTVLGDSSRETSIAWLGAQRMLEELEQADTRQVFARYNATAADDPAGLVAPGSDFAVFGLGPRTDDADGAVGSILFPTPAGAPASLREDLVDGTFGFPRDLNGDGEPDGAEHAGDYAVLPVRIRVEWRGRSGNRFVELATILGGR